MARPRIRTIKPEMWEDERIGELPRDARLLLVGLITMADDEGRLRAKPSLIIGHCFPWDDDVTAAKLERWLGAIEYAGIVLRYEHDGKPYIAFRHWRRHQKVNRATASLLPEPPDATILTDNSMSDHGALHEDSVNGHGAVTDRSSPPAQARGSAPVRSTDNDEEEEDDETRARRTRTVDQDQPPDSLNAELADRVPSVLDVLTRIHGERGGNLPTVRGVGLALQAFDDRDHLAVARELEHWALAGFGMRSSTKDWVRQYRAFLDRSTPGSPSRPLAMVGDRPRRFAAERDPARFEGAF